MPSGACRRKGRTKSFQRQDLHLVSTTIVVMHRENIGRGDKEQPVAVVRLREEPFKFRFKLAWSYPLKGARVFPAAHLPCAPDVADLHNRVQLAWPVTANQCQKIGQIERGPLPVPI